MADSHRTLRRPDADASRPEIDRYHREVAAALEALDVGHGDEFVLINRANFQEQGTLDDLRQLGPFARESETSRQAALDAYPRQGSQRHRILTVFVSQLVGTDGSRAGYTREELERITNLSGNTIHPRVQELIQGGFIEETDRTRRTRNGSEAVVLNITAKARTEIERNQHGAAAA